MAEAKARKKINRLLEDAGWRFFDTEDGPGNIILAGKASLFLYYFLLALNLSDWASESALPSMRQSTIENSEIPLPSLEAQKRILEEFDETQRLVDANK